MNIYRGIFGIKYGDACWGKQVFLRQRKGGAHMCCEIPSGMIADLIGRRKTLILSGLMSALAAWAMICTEYFPVILTAMGLNAISYNLVEK